MIPELTDRRVDQSPELEELTGSGWSRARRLIAGIGVADWVINVALVDDDEMTAMNGRYRQRPEVTDVLSFSYLATSGAGDPDLPREAGYAARDLWCERSPDGMVDAIGELVLAPAFVASRCAAQKWPLDREVPWLLVHGCLHLVGWDHEEQADRKAMLELEEEILAGEGLPHPLRQRS